MNPLHHPSLELCKKLTEIGSPSSYFQHYVLRTENTSSTRVVPHFGLINSKEEFLAWCPQVMEMLDVMPDYIVHENQKRNLQIIKPLAHEGYAVCYGTYGTFASIRNESLPNALAEMVLWLHENGHITFGNP